MGKKILFLCLICFMFLSINVSAMTNETNHINNNGIEVSHKEFVFINDFYGNDFFDEMTEDDYDWIRDLNISDSVVSIDEYVEPASSLILPFSNVHTTANKKLVIARSCTTVCTIIIQAQWINNPTIRSYDLIGARLYNTSLADSNIVTKLVSSQGTEYFSNPKVYSNGFGTTVKLPVSATGIRVEQKFFTSNSGTVYGSYQHATQNITALVSQQYYIDGSGEGGVFKLYGDAIGKYDQMSGVWI